MWALVPFRIQTLKKKKKACFLNNTAVISNEIWIWIYGNSGPGICPLSASYPKNPHRQPSKIASSLAIETLTRKSLVTWETLVPHSTSHHPPWGLAQLWEKNFNFSPSQTLLDHAPTFYLNLSRFPITSTYISVSLFPVRHSRAPYCLKRTVAAPCSHPPWHHSLLIMSHTSSLLSLYVLGGHFSFASSAHFLCTQVSIRWSTRSYEPIKMSV